MKLNPANILKTITVGFVIATVVIIVYDTCIPRKQLAVEYDTTHYLAVQTNQMLLSLESPKYIVNENGTNYHTHTDTQQMTSCPICKKYFPTNR